MIDRYFIDNKGSPQLSLDKKDEHFRSIVHSSDDAIISKTTDGVISSWNPGAEKVFGYSAEEMIGRSMLILFPEDKKEEESFILQRVIDGEHVDHFETTRLRKDGSVINVSVSISPIYDRAGRVIGASKIARDITLQKIAEERLKLAASVFLHTSEGIVITNAQGLIIEVNPACSKITGYSRDEVVGQSPTMFTSSRQGPEVFHAMRQELHDQDHCQGEVWSRRKDGQAYSSLITVSMIRNSLGEPEFYVALCIDITPLRAHQEKLEYLAHYDSLTGLPNRFLLSDRLQQSILLCQSSQQSLAVIYLDLDGFKAINDAYGHDMGDDLLIYVSQRMRAALRTMDTLARIGGDEFVAVLPSIQSSEECCTLVERVLSACNEPFIRNGNVVQVSASIGVTLYPQNNVDADQLLRHADRAMYEAKQTGKNRYHLYDSAQDAIIRSREVQLERLASALENREFVLHYQPQVNMKTGAVLGVEALVRWQHPELGLLAPNSFLPLVEEHPLGKTIGMWVIAAALDQLNQWRQQGLQTRLSINVSASQLLRGNFAKRLAELLEQHPRINPQDLELEILETSALEDIEVVSAVMRECNGLGVGFALDDFGTGYSSLVYLKCLPADILKVDRSFVCNMLDDHEDLAIVQGIIGLATTFKRAVIAEGVETVAHGKKLIAMGCELAQGFAIARPMPGRHFPAWVSAWRPYAAWTSASEDETLP